MHVTSFPFHLLRTGGVLHIKVLVKHWEAGEPFMSAPTQLFQLKYVIHPGRL